MGGTGHYFRCFGNTFQQKKLDLIERNILACREKKQTNKQFLSISFLHSNTTEIVRALKESRGGKRRNLAVTCGMGTV
jgi:hypothetical protein